MAAMPIWCLFFATVIIPKSRASTIQTFLDTLLTGYDKRIKPNSAGVTSVSLDMFVNEFSSVDANSMDYHVSVFFRQRWIDPRLKYTNYTTPVTLGHNRVNELWVPDTFFNNEKTGITHDVTVPNKLLRIHPNGEVLYSQRLTLKLACPMDLSLYPLDTQLCQMRAETYGYTTTELVYTWYTNSKKAIQFDPNITLPEYIVITDRVTLGNCTVEYITGTYSCLVVEFTIRREVGYFVTQTFVPSIMIVCLSFVSFFIDVRAVPARVFIGLITILTIATMNAGVTKTLPRVSYTKAIDVWMTVCLAFVFAALVEFSFANHKARQEDKQRAEEKDKELKQNVVSAFRPKANTSAAGTTEDDDTEVVEVKPNKSDEELGRNTCKNCPMNKWGSKDVEDFAKWFFPVAFLVFNLVYWIFYGISSTVLKG